MTTSLQKITRQCTYRDLIVNPYYFQTDSDKMQYSNSTENIKPAGRRISYYGDDKDPVDKRQCHAFNI